MIEQSLTSQTVIGMVLTLWQESSWEHMQEGIMSIPAVGPVTAVTWVLEVGDVRRFSSIKKAISYCGLCGAEKSSAEAIKRTPLSKQRNKHLQSVLIEAAKLAPSWPWSTTRKNRRATRTERPSRWRASWWPACLP